MYIYIDIYNYLFISKSISIKFYRIYLNITYKNKGNNIYIFSSLKYFDTCI